MTYVDMQRITKQKEEVLVRHDCMKLEIQKINKILQQAIDNVKYNNKRFMIYKTVKINSKCLNKNVKKKSLFTETCFLLKTKPPKTNVTK
jgi:hypothetical protein